MVFWPFLSTFYLPWTTGLVGLWTPSGSIRCWTLDPWWINKVLDSVYSGPKKWASTPTIVSNWICQWYSLSRIFCCESWMVDCGGLIVYYFALFVCLFFFKCLHNCGLVGCGRVNCDRLLCGLSRVCKNPQNFLVFTMNSRTRLKSYCLAQKKNWNLI